MPDPRFILAAVPSTDIYTFPADLGVNGNTHVAQFNVVKYRKPGVSQFDITELLKTIRLPLPQKLSNPDLLEYEEFAAPIIANLLNDKVSFEDAIKGMGLQGIQKGLGDEAKLVSMLAGQSINPRNSNVFKTPKNRELQFEYSLVARTPDESERINQIINLFRFHAYPDVTYGEILFEAPEVFVIRYLTLIGGAYRENPYLSKPLPAALVGINLDENSYGDVAMFKDTFAPVERKLTLIFKELEIDNKKSLADRYEVLGGVGQAFIGGVGGM